MRALNTKALAMVVLSVVAGASFSLGYIVGKATTDDCQYEPANYVSADTGQSGVVPPATQEPEIIIAKSPPASENDREENKPNAAYDKVRKGGEVSLKPLEKPQPVKGRFCVQAGAFNEWKVAESLRVRLKAVGFDAYVKNLKQPGGKEIYRVRVGSFANYEDAESLSKKLTKEVSVKAFVTDTD